MDGKYNTRVSLSLAKDKSDSTGFLGVYKIRKQVVLYTLCDFAFPRRLGGQLDENMEERRDKWATYTQYDDVRAEHGRIHMSFSCRIYFSDGGMLV